MSKRREVEKLIGQIKYQHASGIHTYGACHNKCGNTARGSGECPRCLRKQLAELIGSKKARAMDQFIRRLNKLIDEVLEEAESKNVDI